MRIITAPKPLDIRDDEVAVFLAGGITDCPNWQKEVIDFFKNRTDARLVLLNPRRDNFPIHDPNAAEEQIAWEFNALERMDIFSMYFCAGTSDQPICMYELGRNICRMQMRFPTDWEDRIVVSVEEGYRRKQDVIIQTYLATKDMVPVHPDRTYPSNKILNWHVADIERAYKYVKGR